MGCVKHREKCKAKNICIFNKYNCKGCKTLRKLANKQ